MKESGGMRFNADSTFETNTPDGMESGKWKTDESGKIIYMVKLTGVDTMQVNAISWQHAQANVRTHKGGALAVVLKRVP
jgi:hypothetical protein